MSGPSVEADLAKPVADWLRARGYAVYAEVGRGPIDLVGWNRAEDRIACVELKTAFTWKLLKQAMLTQLVTPYAYAAAGTRPRASTLAKAQKVGLGVLAVRGDLVTVLLEPSPRYEPFTPHRDELLEDLRHSEPSDCGGVPCLPGVGPAQECAKAVQGFLEEHPRADWKTIFAEVPNHYASVRSMTQVMNRRFGIFLASEGWKREGWEYFHGQRT